MTISCKTCPSMRSDETMQRDYHDRLGCSYCPTKGRVLSGPTGFTLADNEKLWANTAETCDRYGQPCVPSTMLNKTASIGLGDPSISVKLSARGVIANNDKPIACTSCQWFVPADIVQKELGYSTPMCKAKGRLLFPRSLVKEAANCGSGVNGPNQTTTEGFIINASYIKTAPGQMTPTQIANVAANASRHAVDPREYVTDRPVSPDNEAACIRAWRRVDDPEGDHEAKWLPIYDGTKLCGFDPRMTYGGHRPDLYVDHMGILYDLTCELLRNETPILEGGAGTGKSETGPWLAWLMDLPHERIDIKKGYESSHLTGQMTLVTDPLTGNPITKFIKSRFAATYDKPGITTINEPNLSADCFEFLRPVFDNAKQLGIDEDSGMPPIERHSLRYILCAQNPVGDPIYVGTEPMNAADIDRVSPVKFALPTEKVEREIITRHCADIGYDIPVITLDKIMQVAKDLRQMIKDGSLPIAWGLRAQIKVAKKTADYSFEKAYRRAVTDGLDDETATQIITSVKSIA